MFRQARLVRREDQHYVEGKKKGIVKERSYVVSGIGQQPELW